MMISLPTHICVTRPQWFNPQNKLQRAVMCLLCEEKWPELRRNCFRVTGPLWGESVKQAVDLPVIWDAMTLIWRHCNVQLIVSSVRQILRIIKAYLTVLISIWITASYWKNVMVFYLIRFCFDCLILYGWLMYCCYVFSKHLAMLLMRYVTFSTIPEL